MKSFIIIFFALVASTMALPATNLPIRTAEIRARQTDHTGGYETGDGGDDSVSP